MIKIRDDKVVADVSTAPTEDYVTFWGKIKGDLLKQTDLIDYINKIKNGLNVSVEKLRLQLNRLSTIISGDDKHQIDKLYLECDSEGNLQNLVITTNDVTINLPVKEFLESEYVNKDEFNSSVDELESSIEELESKIPTSTSQLVNDGDGESSFATQSYLEEYVNNAISSEIPTKTSDLINDGDGTSQFATQEYVSENGGKIDVIKVNGVIQPIVDKTVNITIPKSQGGSSDCVLIYGNVFVETSEGDHVEYHWDPVDSENDNLFYYILEHVQPG